MARLLSGIGSAIGGEFGRSAGYPMVYGAIAAFVLLPKGLGADGKSVSSSVLIGVPCHGTRTCVSCRVVCVCLCVCPSLSIFVVMRSTCRSLLTLYVLIYFILFCSAGPPFLISIGKQTSCTFYFVFLSKQP